MVLSTIIFFILPWFIAIFVFKIGTKIIFLTTPFTSLVANLLNTWTIAYELVEVYPFEVESNFASIPMIIGVIPVSFLILAHYKSDSFQIKWVFVMAIIATLIEGIFLYFDYFKYFKGWNIFLTFLVYFVGYLTAYVYYKLLKKWSLL